LDKAIASIGELVSDKSLIHLLSSSQNKTFSVLYPKMMVGQIASGDRFFASSEDKENLLTVLPEVLCVEMEGAAVAQVCFEYNIPYVVIRTISDEANDNSAVDFKEFVSQVASRFGVEIIKKLLKK
jgi:adenosylhomocysteine nucleosidase